MKKLLYILPLFAAVTLTSCGDDDDAGTPAGGGTAGAGTIAAKVDGTQFNSVAMTTYASEAFGLTINGSNSAGQSISITLMSADEVGTYTGTDVAGGYMEANSSNPSDIKSWQTSGDSTATVTITKWDADKVSGTFSFKAEASPMGSATGTKTITNGSFTDVAIQ